MPALLVRHLVYQVRPATVLDTFLQKKKFRFCYNAKLRHCSVWKGLGAVHSWLVGELGELGGQELFDKETI